MGTFFYKKTTFAKLLTCHFYLIRLLLKFTNLFSHFPHASPLPPVQCEYWQFKCVASGICIDNRRRCDGRPDCAGDGADEVGCEEEEEVIFLERFLAFLAKLSFSPPLLPL